jgi:hypothetical protein
MRELPSVPATLSAETPAPLSERAILPAWRLLKPGKTTVKEAYSRHPVEVQSDNG